jgi:hypothetical protein
MPLTSDLIRISVVAGMPSGKLTLIRRRPTVEVTGRGQRAVVGAQSCGRRRKRRWLVSRGAIKLAPLLSPTVVVAAMTHATAGSTEGEKCKCAHAKREPNPVAAELFHSGAPSVSEAVLPRDQITKTLPAPRTR